MQSVRRRARGDGVHNRDAHGLEGGRAAPRSCVPPLRPRARTAWLEAEASDM